MTWYMLNRFQIDTTNSAASTSDLIHSEPFPNETTISLVSSSYLRHPKPLTIDTTISVVSTSALSHPEPLFIDTKVSVISTPKLGDTESSPSGTLLSTNKSDVATSSIPSIPFPLTNLLKSTHMDSQIHATGHNKNFTQTTENPPTTSYSISKEAITSRKKAVSGTFRSTANQEITSKLEVVETSLQGTLSTISLSNSSSGTLSWNTHSSTRAMDSSKSSHITSIPDESDTQPHVTIELPTRLQNNGDLIHQNLFNVVLPWNSKSGEGWN